MSNEERGPVYGVELIDSLPLNYRQTKGMNQAMPSLRDLLGVQEAKFAGSSSRVVAGYEVLLNHWREQGKEIERLRSAIFVRKNGVNVEITREEYDQRQANEAINEALDHR